MHSSVSGQSLPSFVCSAVTHSKSRFRSGSRRKESRSEGLEATSSSAVLSKEVLEPLPRIIRGDSGTRNPENSVSTLPDSWDTASLEDQFKQATSQARNRALRRTPKRSGLRRSGSALARGKNIVDSRSWGIKRGAPLDRRGQDLLATKYQAWQRVRQTGAELASELGEQASTASLAEATQLTEAELREVQQDGPIAADLLLESVKGLLSKICKNLHHRGWEHEDLYQEAQNFWLEAVLQYDPSKAALTSFGYVFVQQRLALQMDRLSSALDRSAHAIKDERRIGRVQIDLRELFGREPTLGELAAKLGLPAVRIKTLLKLRRNIVSTESSTGTVGSKSDEYDTIGETLEKDNDLGEGVDELMLPILRSELAYGVEEILNKVIENESERRMVLLYYQLVETEGPMTLKTIGALSGVSYETVRTRLHTVMQKLQNSKEVQQKLAHYHTPEILDY